MASTPVPTEGGGGGSGNPSTCASVDCGPGLGGGTAVSMISATRSLRRKLNAIGRKSSRRTETSSASSGSSDIPRVSHTRTGCERSSSLENQEPQIGPTKCGFKAAANAQSWWKSSAMVINIALPNRYFDELGVPRLAA